MKQNYCLSVKFFLIYIKEAIKKVNEKGKSDVTVQREKIKVLEFANDIMKLTENEQNLEKIYSTE